MINTIPTAFQTLITAVGRGDDLPSLQKKQRAILMLSEMAHQLQVLDQERIQSIHTLQQLDIQNTLSTLGRLLKLQQQLDDAAVKNLSTQIATTTLAIQHMENTFAQKATTDQQTIDFLQMQNFSMLYRPIRTLEGQIDELSDGLLASGSGAHDTIKIWNPKTGGCVCAFETSYTTLFPLSDGSLASGLLEVKNLTESQYSIKIWDPKTGACMRTIPLPMDSYLMKHYGLPHNLVQLAGGFLACGLSSGLIYILDLKGTCVHTLEGHKKKMSVELIPLSDGTLASCGTFDEFIKIWNPATGVCTHTLEGHTKLVTSLFQLSDGTLASGSGDKTIKIWDPKTGICMRTIETEGYISDPIIQLSDGNLAAESNTTGSGNIKIWDLKTGTYIHTLKGHTKPVTSLVQLSDGTLASGSWDKTVKIWDPKTGICLHTLGHTYAVMQLIQLSHGSLASRDNRHIVRIWGIE